MIGAFTVSMDNPDLLLLARAQFGLNIGFHILFPSSPNGSFTDPTGPDASTEMTRFFFSQRRAGTS
jgi:hypothetical protein